MCHYAPRPTTQLFQAGLRQDKLYSRESTEEYQQEQKSDSPGRSAEAGSHFTLHSSRLAHLPRHNQLPAIPKRHFKDIYHFEKSLLKRDTMTGTMGGELGRRSQFDGDGL